jgi:hypothetical protein
MVLLSLALMNKKIDSLTFLQSKHSLSVLECEPQVIDGIPALPLKEIDELDSLETALNQSELKKRFVSSPCTMPLSNDSEFS